MFQATHGSWQTRSMNCARYSNAYSNGRKQAAVFATVQFLVADATWFVETSRAVSSSSFSEKFHKILSFCVPSLHQVFFILSVAQKKPPKQKHTCTYTCMYIDILYTHVCAQCVHMHACICYLLRRSDLNCFYLIFFFYLIKLTNHGHSP